MIRRVKREKLPAYIDRNLEEARIKIEQEHDPIVLHEIFLAAMKGAVTWRTKPTIVHQTHLEEPEPPKQPPAQTPAVTYQKPTKPKNPNPKKKTEENKNKARGRDRDNVNNNRGKDDKSRSRSRGRATMVKQWPENKPYHSKNGNKLSRECELWFDGHCFRCGHSSHQGGDCRIYPDRTTILTLCSTCRSGFHEVCKSYKYSSNTPKEDTTNVTLKKIESMIDQLSVDRRSEPMKGYPVVYPFFPPTYAPQPIQHEASDTEGEE